MKKSQRIQQASEKEFERWGTVANFEVQLLFPDTTGTDRRFEFSPIITAVKGAGADEALAGIVGDVQIKGTQKAPAYAVAKLDNWKRFVDSPQPAFFLLVTVDEEFAPVGATLLHVDRVVVGKVIKRLRKIPMEEASTLHKKSMKVPWAQGIQLDPPFERSFVSNVRRIVGNPAAYHREKEQWRRETGYDDHPWKLKFTARVDDMLAHALGEKEEVDASLTQHSVKRFDIVRPGFLKPGEVKLRMDFSQELWLRVVNESGDERVRGRLNHIAALVDLAELPDDAVVWKFVSGPLTLQTNKAGRMDMSLSLDLAVAIRDWGRIGRLLRLLSVPHTVVELIAENDRAMTCGEMGEQPSVGELGELGKLLAGLSRIAHQSRIGGSAKLSGAELWAQESNIAFAAALAGGEPPTLRISLDQPPAPDEEGQVFGALLVCVLRLGPDVLLLRRLHKGTLSVVSAEGTETYGEATCRPVREPVWNRFEPHPQVMTEIREILRDEEKRLSSRYETLLVLRGSWLSE